MSEESAVEPGALENKIIRQVEFYFGDRNLRRDKFLLEQIKKDDGWVPLSVLLTFNRLKQLSSDLEVVATALKMSTILEVNDDGSKVRRPTSQPVPDPMQKRSAEQQLQEQKRTVYAKGFPLDATLDQLEEFFDHFGAYDIITMRKMKEVSSDGKVSTSFKGSVFVEFKEESDAAKFMDTEGLKYKDTTLLREYKNDYIKRKRQEEADRKKALLEEAEKSKKEQQQAKVEYSHGHILKFVGCGENTDREKIKAFFTKYASVLWVEFSRGETKGYVRFQEDDGAQRAVDGATADAEDGKILINGGESQLSVAEGEDEKNFYKRMEETQSSKLKQMKGNKGKSRKRPRENSRNKPNRQQKTDDDPSTVAEEPKDDDNDGAEDDDSNEAAEGNITANTATTNTTTEESPPSPKRVKQEEASGSSNGAVEQETKQDNNNDTTCSMKEES